MIRCFWVACLSLVTSILFAQQEDSLSIKHHSNSLIKLSVVHTGRYNSVVYTDENNTVLNRSEIRNRLLSYQPSADEYQKAKNAKLAGTISAGAGIASCVVGLIANKQQPDGPGVHAAAFLAGGFLVTEIITLGSASHRYKKSIQLYNKQFL